jgi:HEAT repeat protein
VVRLVALETLQRLADPATFGAVQQMLKDSEPNIRAAAVAAAISCDAQRALPLLVNLLKDVSWEVRRETVKALGKIGDETAVDGLCKLLKDRDHDVRECAASALGKIGDANAIQFLVLALLDVESFVRSAAQNALMEINPHWEKAAAAHSMLPQIKAAVKSREYWISHCAARLLEQLSPEAAATPADVTANTNLTSEMNTTTPTSSNLPPAGFAILSDLLADRDRDLRLAATEAFGQLREKSAASLLATALNDTDPFVREAAERALVALN